MAGASSLPTVADIINEALSHLGVYAAGETLAAADQASALVTLQGIIDSFGVQRCLIFDRTALGSFATSAGKAQYTVGTANTNDWVTSFLPPAFDLVTFRSGTLELEVDIATVQQWAAIPLKSMQSNILSECWPDYGATVHTLNFFPTPNGTIPVTLYLETPVQRFTSTANVVALPPGYQELVTFELAIKCSSKFGADIPAWMPAAYAEVKADVKASNFEPIDLVCDPALVKTGSRSGGGSVRFYMGR